MLRNVRESVEKHLPERPARGSFGGAGEDDWPPRSRGNAFKTLVRGRRGVVAKVRRHEAGQDRGRWSPACGRMKRSLCPSELLSPTARGTGLFPTQRPDRSRCRDAPVIGYRPVGPRGLHRPAGVTSKPINRSMPDVKLVIIRTQTRLELTNSFQ